jgi:hypothetical protein
VDIRLQSSLTAKVQYIYTGVVVNAGKRDDEVERLNR